MTHVGNISNHFDAMHHCLSGQAGAPADSPYIGSVLARVRPSQRNVASYVWLIKCVGDPTLSAGAKVMILAAVEAAGKGE